MSRHSTARGSNTGLVPVGPAKVKTRKSVLFTEGTPEVKISQRWNMRYFLSNHIICKGKIKRPLVNFVGLVKTMTEMVTGCLRTTKSCHICKKVILVSYGKYGTLSIYDFVK